MRSTITITVAIGLVMTMATGTAFAATNGTVGKYSRKAVKVKSNTGFPTQCRPAILRAVQTWNSKNPPFQYSYSTTNTAPSIENGNDTDLQFDYSTSVTSANKIDAICQSSQRGKRGVDLVRSLVKKCGVED